MRQIVGLVALCFLSTCASAPALAQATCISTVTAAEMAQSNGITPTILRGKQMAPFIAMAIVAGSKGVEKANFVAVIVTPDGTGAVFFGNAVNTCGPMMISAADVHRLLKSV